MVSLADRAGYDVGLHLLDRQIIGADGRLAGKVDDVELCRDDTGVLVPTALLVGLPALLPRFGGRIGAGLARAHRLVREAAADQELPLVVDVDLVEDVSSDVRLSEPVPGLLHRMAHERAADPRRCRVGDLLGLPVRCAALPRRSRLLDLRLVGAPGAPGEHRVVALLVGPGRPGALFGYDRSSRTRPRRRRGRRGPAAPPHPCRRPRPRCRLDIEAGEIRIGAEASLAPLRG